VTRFGLLAWLDHQIDTVELRQSVLIANHASRDRTGLEVRGYVVGEFPAAIFTRRRYLDLPVCKPFNPREGNKYLEMFFRVGFGHQRTYVEDPGFV
jgi:hypothetical protein